MTDITITDTKEVWVVYQHRPHWPEGVGRSTRSTSAAHPQPPHACRYAGRPGERPTSAKDRREGARQLAGAGEHHPRAQRRRSPR